jgi:glucosamine-6-phosphate deaminase
MGMPDPRWPWTVHAGPEALGGAIAAGIVVRYLEARAVGRRFLLGCPGGRTPRPIYAGLARLGGALDLDWSGLSIVMMDDYLVPDGDRLVACPATVHFSCRRFAELEIVALLDAGRPPARRVGGLMMPDAAAPAAYDDAIAQVGGIDVFLVASGASDGHVAFNPPGTPAESTSRIVALAETTRRDNLQTFPQFRGLEEVPTHGVSVGLATIAAAREVVMVLHGAGKGLSLRRLIDSADFDPAWPATILHRCRGAVLHADRAAWDAARA